MADEVVTYEKQQAEKTKELIGQLATIGGGTVTQDTTVRHIPGTQIGLPSDPTEMEAATAARLLLKVAEDRDRTYEYSRMFPYRPYDGALALERALLKISGVKPTARRQRQLEGPPPELAFLFGGMGGGESAPTRVEVPTSADTTVSAPWGELDFALFDNATITVSQVHDKLYGLCSFMVVHAQKRYEPAIMGLWKVVLDELRERSIYKGKTLTDVSEIMPRFFDPYDVRREQVVYTRDTERRFENTIWGPIRTAQAQREEGLPLNTKNLITGRYGVGKTLALSVTAQVAVQNGWTFIQARTDEDLAVVLKTAVMYQPAVVAIEDVDLVTDTGSDQKLAKLMELFDGMQMKRSEVMVVMTSNNPGGVHKGLLRAGRIDSLTEIGDLDQEAVERLIRALIPAEKLDQDTDYGAVHRAMEGFEPAFVKETFSSAARAAVCRTGSRDYRLTTSDFEAAAANLKPQHDLHREQPALQDTAVLERFFAGLLDDRLEQFELVDSDGDRLGRLRQVPE